MSSHYHLYGKRTLGALAVILLFTLPRPGSAQVDVGLSPMKVEFPGVAGKSYSGSLTLNNAGGVKAHIRVEMADFYIDDHTTPQFVAHLPAEKEYSCASWLSANPMEFDVQPKSQSPVRYTVHVPGAVSERSYHCALAFRTIPQADETAGTSLRTAVRLITVFYATVGKPAVSGLIKDLKLERVAGKGSSEWRAVVVMENSGFMLYRPVGELKVLDPGGRVVETMSVPSFPVLPKRLQPFLLPLKSADLAGPYILKARIQVGGEIQEASVAVTAAVADDVANPVPQ